MFAVRLAKVRTKAPVSTTDSLADQNSTLAGHRPPRNSLEQALLAQRPIDNQAMPRPTAQRPGSLNGASGGGHEHAIHPESMAPQETQHSISWDFSRVSTYAPGGEPQPQARSSINAPLLPSGIHPKLVVGRVDDRFEHEADQITDQVMRMPEPSSIAIPTPPISRTPETGPAKTSHGAADGELGLVNDVLRDAGQPLDPATRADFESRMGHDFSRVRVHTDTNAAASARAVSALAYTVGHNVTFAEGMYAPHTAAGRRLLAHELVHVRQAGGERTYTSTGVLRRQIIPSKDQMGHPQPGKVKQLVQLKDPTANHELGRLIARNALDNRPVSVGMAEVGGATHIWTVRVEMGADLGFTGLIRGKAHPEKVSTKAGTAKSGSQTSVHETLIQINKTLRSSPQELAEHPNIQERMNYLAAEALLHELEHARLQMDESLAKVGLTALSTTGYQFGQLRAKLPAAAAEQDAVKRNIVGLLNKASDAVGKPVLDPAGIPQFVEATLERKLLEEKFVKQTAGRAFGLGASISNAEVTEANAQEVADDIIEMAVDIDRKRGVDIDRNRGNALKTDRGFESAVSKFKTNVELLFDKLDSIASGAPPGAVGADAIPPLAR